MNAHTLSEAMTLWEGTGTAVAEAARAVTDLLAKEQIPSLVAGGLAVQLHGYPRTTVDVDIIVPDLQRAHEFLISKGYKASLLQPLGVIDPAKDVRIDLLPAGRCLKRECSVPFPSPPPQTPIMQPVTLPELISLKLDSWKHTPTRRLQDKTDVIQLIIRNELPRDLAVHPAVADDYRELWDAIQSEPPGPLA